MSSIPSAPFPPRAGLAVPALLALLPFAAACGSTAATDDRAATGATAAPGPTPLLSLVHGFDPARREDTCKVFHHLRAPDGRLLTKGAGGTFPHHRGVFFGYNRVTVDGAGRFDFWHCNRGETLQFQRMVPAAETGRTPDWQCAEIRWLKPDGRAVVLERRCWRERRIDADIAEFEFAIELDAPGPAVTLQGDAHHAGFHVRALEQFAPDDAPKIRYLLPDGAKARGDDVHEDCAWVAAILPLPDGPVTVVHVTDAQNPRPVRYSARPYGRFGSVSHLALEPGAPSRVLRYRLVVATGAREDAWCAAQATTVRAASESAARESR